MKKTVKISLLLALTLTAMLILASCFLNRSPLNPNSPLHNHVYGEWVLKTSPTCTEEGIEVRYCYCTHPDERSIPALGHAYNSKGECERCTEGSRDPNECKHESIIVTEGKAATCTRDGLSARAECDNCGVIIAEHAVIPKSHNYSNGACIHCGEAVSYEWNSKTIHVQLYENDNGGELSSGLKRYYAGADTSKYDDVDILVRNRNTAAATATGLDVIYSYETSYTVGNSVDKIQAYIGSGSAAAPDIFVNYAYDMTAASLRGCFANLFSNTAKSTSAREGTNYFSFVNPGYTGEGEDKFDLNAGQGYLYEYMKSLALPNVNGSYDKMYCVASNYTLDAIRAIPVIPVNLTLLEETTGISVDDLYDLVWSYGWTYDELIKLSSAAYRDNNKVIEGADIMDTLGFCVPTSSPLSSYALLYGSSAELVTLNSAVDGRTSYGYPTENGALVTLTEAIDNLLNENTDKGICTVYDFSQIRSHFTTNEILFGGIVTLGTLEGTLYRYMIDNEGGIGILPIPLDRQYAEKSLVYNTAVYELARVAAISAITTSFSQCTAYLDYQSTHSADVLGAYLGENLMTELEGGGFASENVRMVAFIRNHAGVSDAIYESLSSSVKDTDASAGFSDRWHHIISSNGYTLSDATGAYGKYASKKQELLEAVLAGWTRLQ